MIDDKKYQAMRADFVKVYEPLLCEESLFDIQLAADVNQFIGVLHKYSVFNSYRPFPDVDWVRKWFADELDVLNSNNCYLDQVCVVADPHDSILVFGKSQIVAYLSEPRVFHLIIQDETLLQLHTHCNPCVFVKQKGESKVEILYKDKYSRIKVRKYAKNQNEPQWK